MFLARSAMTRRSLGGTLWNHVSCGRFSFFFSSLRK
uniref:Uncharacterized protein n=1 Tax=Arundo donax TaxID=35708 RepID=A0A0A9UKE3_ARUDO